MNADSESVAEVRVESFDFESIFLAQYSRIVRIIVRTVNDPARNEDLAMEVFGKLWRKPPRKIADAGGSLYRTAVTSGLDELRRRARREKGANLFGSSLVAID